MKNEFIAYEYKDITISKKRANMFLDLIENFGWEVTNSSKKLNKVEFSLKKCYNDNNNKEEILKLEKDFFSGFDKLEKINNDKKEKGQIVSISVGLVGTACMAGATFSFLASLIAPMVALAIPGFALWGLAPVLNNKINKKKEQLVNEQSQELTNKLYSIAKQAFELLNK